MFMSPKLNQSHDFINLRTAKGWRLLAKKVWQYKWIYLIMLLPGLAVTIVFRYLPMPGIALAFKTFKPVFGATGLFDFLTASPWVGFQHFERLFRESAFWQATGNTLYISLLKLIFGFPFPIILAILINEMVFKKYKRVLQTIYTFPHFLSWVVLSGIILNLFGDTGVIKKVAVIFDPQLQDTWNVLYNTAYFRTLLIVSDIWKEGGWGTILYLAAITGIDPSLNEAATIDGANRFQRIIHITLPSILDLVVIMFILSVGNMMNANFDQIFNLYSAPVFKVADVIDTYVYRLTFQSTTVMDYGFSTAVGLFKNVINFALLLGANYCSKAAGGDGIM